MGYLYIFLSFLSLFSLYKCDYEEFKKDVNFNSEIERIYMKTGLRQPYILYNIHAKVAPAPYTLVIGWLRNDYSDGGDLFIQNDILNDTSGSVRPCLYQVPDNSIYTIAIKPINYISAPYQLSVLIRLYTSEAGTSYGTNLLTAEGTYRDFFWDVSSKDKLTTINIIKDGSTTLNGNIFDEVVVTKGHCYNGTGEKREFKDDDLKSMDDDPDSGLPVKELTPGRWWVSMKSMKKEAYTDNAIVYNFKVKVVETCLMNCSLHGTCLENPAFCLCHTWWDGEDCSEMFKGAYVLIVWASIFFALTVIVLGRTVWNILRTGLCSSSRGLLREPLLNDSSESDEGEEDKRLEEEPAPVYRQNLGRSQDRTANIVRRQLAGEDDRDE